MKKTLLIICIPVIIILIWGVVGILFSQNEQTNSHSSLPTFEPTAIITPTPTSAQDQSVAYCLPQDLKAMLTISHAAGNIYGTATIQNISSQTCEILGNRLLTPVYNAQVVKNIDVKPTGTPENTIFTLQPGQTIYSQIHYPNGPQCNGPIKPEHVTFTYEISPLKTVTFIDTQGIQQQLVQTCSSLNNLTIIDIWNMSSKPITP